MSLGDMLRGDPAIWEQIISYLVQLIITLRVYEQVLSQWSVSGGQLAV